MTALHAAPFTACGPSYILAQKTDPFGDLCVIKLLICLRKKEKKQHKQPNQQPPTPPKQKF